MCANERRAKTMQTNAVGMDCFHITYPPTRFTRFGAINCKELRQGGDEVYAVFQRGSGTFALANALHPTLRHTVNDRFSRGPERFRKAPPGRSLMRQKHSKNIP